MTRRTIETSRAPAAIGPYSQAIACDGWVYCSGQIPLDPETGELVSGTIEEETRRALANLVAVLEAAGCTPVDVVKTTVYLADMADFPRVNAVYAEVFGEHRPARAAIGVASLPKGARVEVEAIARRP